MITVEELRKMQDAFEERIYSHAITVGIAQKDKFEAIADGVSNPEAYLSSYPKVTWVGKEAYDGIDEFNNPYGGGWSLTEGFLTNKKWSTKTWRRVIYTMYALRNNLRYCDLDYLRDNPRMGDIMQTIAWINMSKMPGRTTSNYSYVRDYNNYWKSIVLEQLQLYEPNVIIFSNTFSSCYKDFFPEGKEPDEKVYFKDGDCFICAYKLGKQLILDPYHPGRPMSEEQEEFYVNSLIDTINKYFPRDNRIQRP